MDLVEFHKGSVVRKLLTEECKAIMEALNCKITPKTFTGFAYDTHACFQQSSCTGKFLEILNKQDSAIKFKGKFEDYKKSLNFLDINITNNTTNKHYKFKVHRKDTVPNIHIKPNSCINLALVKSVFKCFLNQLTQYM